MKNIIITALLFITSFVSAQEIKVGDTLEISSIIGLDFTQTEFSIGKFEGSLGKVGSVLVLKENHTFVSYGYSFCGVGEKAYVYGTYKLNSNNTLALHFHDVVYKNIGKETKRTTINKETTYLFDLTKGKMTAVKHDSNY